MRGWRGILLPLAVAALMTALGLFLQAHQEGFARLYFLVAQSAAAV